jgi:hypothetical protein
MQDFGSVCSPTVPASWNLAADLHYSIYFLYAVRPLESWNSISRASQNCIFLLRAGIIEQESPAYRDALQRIYWICYIIDR